MAAGKLEVHKSPSGGAGANIGNSTDMVMCAYKKYKRQTYYNKKRKKKYIKLLNCSDLLSSRNKDLFH